MNIFQKTILILSIFALGIYVGGNYDIIPGSRVDKKPVPILSNLNQSGKPDLSLFWKVWDTVKDKYLRKDKEDPDKMVDGAIAGMVASLGDPYTVYLPSDQNKNFKDNLSGKYSGVGIQLGYTSQKMVVIAPLDDTPAARAGIKPNDQIVKIGDKNAENITIPEAVSLIRGEAGTEVKLSLLHEGQDKPYEVTLKREQITVKTVVYKALPNNTAYLKITQFGDNTKEEWSRAVNDVVKSKADKVVVDLRNNPGGRLDTAVSVASEFLSKGLIARQEWYDGKKQDYPTLGGGKLITIPLVVLVNKGSASASEIFAGAMKDNNRAKIVGETTFGKGTVQEVEEFDNGAGLHLTISRWLTPNGTWMDETKGLKPDVEVKPEETKEEKISTTSEDLTQDPAVKKALEIL